MRHLQRIGLLLGAALFVWLVARIGPSTLWSESRALGWGIAVVVAIEGVADFLHALAWQRCFAPAHRPSCLNLWAPHLAGSAVNFVTPTATLGGEIVRATFLPRDIPRGETVASLTINKLTAMIADVGVAVAAIAVVLFHVPLSDPTRIGLLVGGGGIVLGTAVFLRAQRCGRLAGHLGEHPLLARVIGRGRTARVVFHATELDNRLAAFHAERPGALSASVLAHALGVGLGMLQLLVFLHLTGVSIGLGAATTAFLVARGLDAVAFFVPVRLGAHEGTRVLAFTLVGLPASLGLLYALVIRIEQLFWAAAGLFAYAGLLRGRRHPVDRVGRVTA